jgi:hypothetical protein
MTPRALPGLIAIAVILASGCSERRATVEVVARGRSFLAPDSIPAGWTTFRFKNESGFVHFAVVERLPEGVGVREQQEHVAPVFQQGMDLLVAGKTDAAMQKFGELPAWFGQVVFQGGPGLTSPGHTSETTIRLEPGRYMLECYVKTDGVFHSYNPDSASFGMVHEFTVTGPVRRAPEPTAAVALTLSSAGGIEMTGDPVAGEQAVAVRFQDQKAYENFVGHDVHLVRLTDTTDLARLTNWMDWTRAEGLQTPAPAEFLGGINEMPAGSIGYLSVRLTPGRYAWIAEVPRADEKGMLREFAVR